MSVRLRVGALILASAAGAGCGAPTARAVLAPCPPQPPAPLCDVNWSLSAAQTLKSLESYATAATFAYEQCKTEVLNRRDAERACAAAAKREAGR